MGKKKAPPKPTRSKVAKRRTASKKTTGKKSSRKRAPATVAGVASEIVPSILGVAREAAQLPIAVYSRAKSLTVEELVEVFRASGNSVTSPKRNPAKQTPATRALDEQVLKFVRKVGQKRDVRISDLMEKLPSHSDQQIRRSLVRLQGAGVIETQGATKNKVYRPLAA